MSSFEKKLAQLLESAADNKAITKQNADQLMAFMKSDEYENKGWFNLSGAMGGLGSLIVCLGISLIIAKNWYALNDFTKISGFIALLGGMHFVGLYASGKGYNRTAQALHFLGAGLVLAGIGLVAQIFHLHSDKGEAFLIWTIMILPLAALLRNGPIALMSAIAFTLWGNIYMRYSLVSSEWMHIIAFNSSICILTIMAGLLLKYKNSEIASYLQTPGMIILVFGSYLFGFSHNFGDIHFPKEIHILPYTVLLLAIISGVYLFIKNKQNRFDQYFILAIGANIVPVLLICTAFLFGFNSNSYFEHFSFGWTHKIYYLPLLMSISAWIGYFAFAFWGVIFGALNHHRWMLNCNIILIGIGVFTRFIDLVGNMMDTGMMFIVCGLFIFAIGFGLEKWRRKLIAHSLIKAGA